MAIIHFPLLFKNYHKKSVIKSPGLPFSSNNFPIFFLHEISIFYSYGNNKFAKICSSFILCLAGRCTKTLRCFINCFFFVFFPEAKCNSHEKLKTLKRYFQVFPYKNEQQLLFI